VLRPVAAAAGVAHRVLTCGYQREAARWLPLMDLLVLPSRTEGQGLAVLEAFRAGVPVVASRIPALAEIISHGQNGFLFEPDNPTALAACIRGALALPPSVRDVLVSTAFRRFRDEYTLDRMVARHEALYAQVGMRVEVEG
jgi:glycosyltransferase involved in cell wall biosynthesis